MLYCVLIPVDYTVKHILIRNDKGQTVAQLKDIRNLGKLDVDVSTYPTGIYLISCLISNRVVTKRFVVSR